MGKAMMEVNFDYLRDFFRVYEGKRKHAIIRTYMMHNVYAEIAYDYDKMLEQFLLDIIGP
jgi:uncharacterized membrane protein